MKLDPVCGMNVDPKSAAASADYKGETFYFCSKGCKAAFEKEPEKYLGSESEKDGNEHHAHH